MGSTWHTQPTVWVSQRLSSSTHAVHRKWRSLAFFIYLFFLLYTVHKWCEYYWRMFWKAEPEEELEGYMQFSICAFFWCVCVCVLSTVELNKHTVCAMKIALAPTYFCSFASPSSSGDKPDYDDCQLIKISFIHICNTERQVLHSVSSFHVSHIHAYISFCDVYLFCIF